jgi:hypothetical protein
MRFLAVSAGLTLCWGSAAFAQNPTQHPRSNEFSAASGDATPGASLPCPSLPGTPLKYMPASTGVYLGSPAICLLPNGDYLASHDYFGPGSTEKSLGQTFLYRSTDRGRNWILLGQINQLVCGLADTNGQFWSHFIQLNGQLYTIANRSGGGSMVIRQATNNASAWSPVSGAPTYAGQLFPRSHWVPGHTYAIKHGRIWFGVERAGRQLAVLSAPTNSNLLDSHSWAVSAPLSKEQAWLNGTFNAWQEANLLEDRLGGLVIVARVDNRYPNRAAIGSKAAILRLHYTGGTNATLSFSGGSFDPTAPNGSGFIDFPGGCTRFTLRFDPISQKYWTLCNYLPRQFRNPAYNAERFRAILVLASSADLKDWTVERVVMADGRLCDGNPLAVAAAFHGNETAFGFQYVDWQFDGSDLVATVRAGFCDQFGGSRSGHDANYYLFRRVENFRMNAGAETVRSDAFQLSGANGLASVTFPTRPARLYRLQCSEARGGPWQDMALACEGFGNHATLHLTGQPPSGRWYRIAESPSWLP